MGVRRRDTGAPDYTKNWQGQGTKQLGQGRAKRSKTKNRESHRRAGGQTCRQAHRQADRQKVRQTKRHTDGLTDKHTGRQTGGLTQEGKR